MPAAHTQQTLTKVSPPPPSGSIAAGWEQIDDLIQI